MRLIAVAHQLTGVYGTVTAGEEFECRDDLAKQLVRSGSARKAAPPRVLYETKVVVPEAPEVGARPPFRNVPVHHAESPPVAPEGDPVLPAADLPAPGAADSGGRGKRKRFGSG
jgi:hypothetical protein